MDRTELLAFMRKGTFWTQASATVDGTPQAAVVGVAVTSALELVFDTLDTTRKCKNLRANPKIALVMWDGAATVQLEGLADEPTGAELAGLKAVYFAQFPDGPSRESWPGIAYFRVRPSWVRHTDFSGATPLESEFRFP